MNESLELPRQIRKFNPGTLQSDEEVIRQFVVRKPKLGIVLEVLRGNIDSPSCQHVLLVAPRGRGKSMLLARIAAELRSNCGLSERLLPVRFMEESQEIFDMTDFWLESLFYLARESKMCDSELAQELQDVHADLTAEWRGQDLEERARATVLEAADRLGRKLVLMVENLQALCGNVDDDFGWKLRGALQSEPQIILLATATSRFKGLDDAREPFFELFRIIRLEPLDTEECRLLWQVVSGDVVTRREIRPLEILTGGNPRLLVIIGDFARHRSLRQLMDELVRLIDDHTEYFRGHLEVFAKTERRVYLATIDLWQPSSTGEIAARARMDVRAVSTLLGRLVERGAVIVERHGKKRLYAAAERLYSIYYKLRRERDEAAVVRNLIHFMAVFYSEAELTEMSGNLRSEAAQWPVIFEGIKSASAESPQVSRIFSNEAWPGIGRVSDQVAAIDNREAEQILDAITVAADEGAFEKVIEVVDQFLASQRAGSSQAPKLIIALALLAKAFAYGDLEEAEAEMAAYDEVVERFGDCDALELQMHVARALFNKGAIWGQLGKVESEIVVYDEVVERFGDIDIPKHQVPVAMALVNKGYRLGQLGQDEAAIATCEEVVERFGDSDAPDLQAQVAMALFNKGAIWGQLGKLESEIAVYGEVVERFGDLDVPKLQEQVAMALVDKGHRLGQLGQDEAAIAAYEEVVERFGDSEALKVQAEVAAALVRKLVVRGKLGEAEVAIATSDEVIERFGDSEAPELQLQAAMALANKAIALEKIGEAEAAIATCGEVVERFRDSEAPELRFPVAKALTHKGFTLLQLGEPEAAIATCGEVIEHFGDSEAPAFQSMVARALVNKAFALEQLGETEAAIAICDEVVEIFEAIDAPELQEGVARALNKRGLTQERLGDFQAAIEAWDEVVKRFRDSEVPELQAQIAEALVNKAGRQVAIGHTEGTLHTCDELERRLGVLTHKEKIMFEWRAKWLRTKALLLQEKYPAAMDTFRSMYAAFVLGHESAIRQMLVCVSDLIATGASERDLAEVLSSDREKADTLLPLVVALRQRIGETVRAPGEVLEVAADIRERIETKPGTDTAAPLTPAPLDSALLQALE